MQLLIILQKERIIAGLHIFVSLEGCSTTYLTFFFQVFRRQISVTKTMEKQIIRVSKKFRQIAKQKILTIWQFNSLQLVPVWLRLSLRTFEKLLIAKETGNNGHYLIGLIRPYRPFALSIGSGFSFSFTLPSSLVNFPVYCCSFNWNLWIQTTSFFLLVGRMVQIKSCISSKPFRAWLFIWHVDPVKRIQRQAIKTVHL